MVGDRKESEVSPHSVCRNVPESPCVSMTGRHNDSSVYVYGVLEV